MRFVRRLLGFALLGAGVVYLRGRRRALAVARGADERFDDRVGTSAPSTEDLIDVPNQAHDLSARGDVDASGGRLPRR
jgi:hypothetical protein